MAVPLAIAAGVVRHRRRIAPQLLIALFVLTAIGLVLVIGVLGALFGIQPLQGNAGPSATARADIPPAYLELYQAAGQRYGIDPWILAGIGSIETDHGQFDRARRAGRRQRLRLLRRADAVLRRRLAEHVGRLRRRRRPRRSQRPRTIRPTRSPPRRATSSPAARRATTTPRCSLTTTPSWYVTEVLAKADGLPRRRGAPHQRRRARRRHHRALDHRPGDPRQPAHHTHAGAALRRPFRRARSAGARRRWRRSATRTRSWSPR